MTDVTGFADQLLTVHDAALMLACSVAEVRRLRADGELVAFYVGTEAMFRWANVRSLQRRQEEMGLAGGTIHDERRVDRLVAGEVEKVVVLPEARARGRARGAKHDQRATLERGGELLPARSEFLGRVTHALGCG